MSEFRAAYSKLIRAVWDDPGLTKQIQSDPGLLSSYGFTDTPTSVSFEDADGKATVAGYDDQMTDAADKSVTFYIPPKPGLSAAAGSSTAEMVGTDACCCCCPCCTCT